MLFFVKNTTLDVLKLYRLLTIFYYYDSKFAGDDFLAGVLSDGEEDALIDMDI
jgi:hypothetical protein